MSLENPVPGTVTVLASDTRVRIALAGELDLASRGDLQAACSDALTLGLPIDVDFRDVTFLDSSVISVLFTLSTSTRLRVIAPNELVRFLLDVTGLSSQVEVVDDDLGTPPTS